MQIPKGWSLGQNHLQRRFTFKSFKAALDFVDTVGDLAEQAKHHPDIHIFYNEVLLELWTHTANGVTEKDSLLAEKANQLYSN